MSQPMSETKSVRPPFHWEKGGLLESFRYDLVYSKRAATRPATGLLREWVLAQFGDLTPAKTRSRRLARDA